MFCNQDVQGRCDQTSSRAEYMLHSSCHIQDRGESFPVAISSRICESFIMSLLFSAVSANMEYVFESFIMTWDADVVYRKTIAAVFVRQRPDGTLQEISLVPEFSKNPILPPAPTVAYPYTREELAALGEYEDDEEEQEVVPPALIRVESEVIAIDSDDEEEDDVPCAQPSDEHEVIVIDSDDEDDDHEIASRGQRSLKRKRSLTL